MHLRSSRQTLGILLLTAAAAAGFAAVALAAMQSEKLAPRLCKTTGGGKFVEIPSFPGEMLDRRLLRDVAWMQKKFKILVTDGYSTDPVHSANGEHPIGLALDIVPDAANGGRWRDIGRLARWAEPEPDQPRAPFRWVGYNGDANHGRGHHLHLSYAHSKSKFDKPTRVAYSVKCPRDAESPAPDPPDEPDPADPPNAGGTGPDAGERTGGKKGKGGKQTGSGSKGSGGYGPSIASTGTEKRKIRRQARSGSSVESGGVGLG